MRAAAILAACLAASPATAERLVGSLSSHRVTIGSNYTGAQLVAFGAIERDAQTVARAGNYDAVITVTGPRQSITVREKEALGPIWLNRSQQKFIAAPAFLAVLSSRPMAEISSDGLRRRLRIGIDSLVNAPEFALDRGDKDEAFRAALVRLKSRERLYVQNERGVTFLTGTIFRAPIPLAATAPPGNYDVELALLADGLVLARTHSNFEVVKVGFEQQMADLARERSWLYGLGMAAIALTFGWFASVIFRRD